MITIQSKEVNGSYQMEKEGLHRCMEFLQAIALPFTDRHKQINKWLCESYPDIKHYFDTWHVAKDVNLSMFQ